MRGVGPLAPRRQLSLSAYYAYAVLFDLYILKKRREKTVKETPLNYDSQNKCAENKANSA